MLIGACNPMLRPIHDARCNLQVVDGEVRAPLPLDAAPMLKQFFLVDGPELARRLSVACPSLQLTGLDTIKLQWNEGWVDAAALFSVCVPMPSGCPVWAVGVPSASAATATLTEIVPP